MEIFGRGVKITIKPLDYVIYLASAPGNCSIAFEFTYDSKLYLGNAFLKDMISFFHKKK